MARTKYRAVHVALAALLTVAAAVSTSAMADVSDWIARLHGAPPDSAKAAPPAELATVSAAPGVPIDSQVERFLRTLANAIKARDGSLLEPLLAASYTVDGLPTGAKAADFMAKAVERIRGPRQIVIESIETTGPVRTVKAQFDYVAEDSALKTFILDASGKLLRCDLFRLAHP
jgi:hypothetical protein